MLSISKFAFLLCFAIDRGLAQSSSTTGYFGYKLNETGDGESTTYQTLDTPANGSVYIPEPDVYLHADVHVGEIDILVANLSAKINLDAQVLQLLQFNAGVDVSINRVFLTIQDVNAEVFLEARLSNVVSMISDVLDSLDLNPVLATLGKDLGNITSAVGGAVGGLTGSSGGSSGSSSSGGNSTLQKRYGIPQPSYELTHNILYSVNDYSGNTHTNRILDQDGSIIEQYLDNDGRVRGQKTVGNYLTAMTATGHKASTTRDGQNVEAYQYSYHPLPGVSAIANIYKTSEGAVVGAQVISESFGGGMSTVGD